MNHSDSATVQDRPKTRIEIEEADWLALTEGPMSCCPLLHHLRAGLVNTGFCSVTCKTKSRILVKVRVYRFLGACMLRYRGYSTDYLVPSSGILLPL